MKISTIAISLSFGLALATGTAAQEKKIGKNEVPAPVLTAFARAFPKAQAVAYAQEIEDGKTLYEVESKEGTIHRDVTFEADGKLVVVEEAVDAKNLPASVRATFEKEKGKLTLAERITRGTTIEYEGHFTDGEKEYEVVTDAKGKVLKREPSTKD